MTCMAEARLYETPNVGGLRATLLVYSPCPCRRRHDSRDGSWRPAGSCMYKQQAPGIELRPGPRAGLRCSKQRQAEASSASRGACLLLLGFCTSSVWQRREEEQQAREYYFTGTWWWWVQARTPAAGHQRQPLYFVGMGKNLKGGTDMYASCVCMYMYVCHAQ